MVTEMYATVGVLAGGGRRRASGMIIITSIDREAAHDDGRDFINFPVNLLYSDFSHS